jgi:hypothetical protein
MVVSHVSSRWLGSDIVPQAWGEEDVGCSFSGCLLSRGINPKVPFQSSLYLRGGFQSADVVQLCEWS